MTKLLPIINLLYFKNRQFTDQIFTVFSLSVQQKTNNKYNDKRKKLFNIRDN